MPRSHGTYSRSSRSREGHKRASHNRSTGDKDTLQEVADDLRLSASRLDEINKGDSNLTTEVSSAYEVSNVDLSDFTKHKDVAKALDENKSYAKANDLSEVAFDEYTESDKQAAADTLRQERNTIAAIRIEFVRNADRSDETLKLEQEFIRADRELDLLIRKYEGRELYSESELEKAKSIYAMQDAYNTQLAKDHQAGNYQATGIIERRANEEIKQEFPEGTPAYRERKEKLELVEEFVNSKKFNPENSYEWVERIERIQNASWRETDFCSNEETGELYAKGESIKEQIELKRQQAQYDKMPSFISEGKMYDKEFIREEIDDRTIESDTFDVSDGKVDFLEYRETRKDLTPINGVNSKGKLKKGKKIEIEYNKADAKDLKVGKLYKSDSGKYYLITEKTGDKVTAYSFKDDLRAVLVFNTDEKTREIAVIDDKIRKLRSSQRVLTSNVKSMRGNQLGGLALLMEGSAYRYGKNKEKITLLKERKQALLEQ